MPSKIDLKKTQIHELRPWIVVGANSCRGGLLARWFGLLACCFVGLWPKGVTWKRCEKHSVMLEFNQKSFQKSLKRSFAHFVTARN